MTDPRLITDEELAALRTWHTDKWRIAIATFDAILARNPEPWSPSEDDITAYCEARGWGTRENRTFALVNLTEARERGWDAVPRRIDKEQQS